ncbi:MAG: slipin family protein [Abditibacteriales bacterium]|nr:slipin family protein [Abditibacteriales bacterium]MDW8365415.1 slipin family protein [Abditibacteriales bacterium]
MAFNFYGYGTEHREATFGAITIYEYERGLLYVRGKFVRVLEPGRYRLLPFTHKRIVVVDVRRAAVQIVNQKLLTADQITVTLNIVADYEIADVAAAVHKVADFGAQLYEDVQLAARNVVGAVTVDALLKERVSLNAQILEAVKPLAEGYGVRVLNVGIKDVILAPKVRDLLMKEAEAKRVAQAMLIGAREEVAAMRALANAARLAAEHPHLLRLRELDTVRAFAQTPGNTVVVGVGGVMPLKQNTSARGDEPTDEAL